MCREAEAEAEATAKRLEEAEEEEQTSGGAFSPCQRGCGGVPGAGNEPVGEAPGRPAGALMGVWFGIQAIVLGNAEGVRGVRSGPSESLAL